MITITIRCKGTHYLKLSELTVLQEAGEAPLKELSPKAFDKIKHSLETHGFWFPFFFWKDPEDGTNYILDGTQRDKVLTWMAERPEEYELPDKFPAVLIEAKDKKEAAEAILVISSRYGEMTEQGLISFVDHFNLDPRWEEISFDLEFPELDLDNFNFDLPGSGTKGDMNRNACRLVPESDRYREQYGVIVICKDEVDQERTYYKLLEQGYECRVVVT